MKYLIIASMLTMYSLSSFALGQNAAKDCCPSNTNCGGKINCIDAGLSSRKAERREARADKKLARKNRKAAGKKQ